MVHQIERQERDLSFGDKLVDVAQLVNKLRSFKVRGV
jgi:hypothetical protein